MICAALAPDTQFFVKAGDPRPHIITKCRGQPLICLYDTGSSPSLIKRQVLSALENAAGCTFPKRDTQVRCTGAFEGSVQATQKVMLDISRGEEGISGISNIRQTVQWGHHGIGPDKKIRVNVGSYYARAVVTGR